MNAYRYHANGTRHKSGFDKRIATRREMKDFLANPRCTYYVVIDNEKVIDANTEDAIIIRDAREAYLEKAKVDAKKIAKDLYYPQKVINAIMNALTETEITRILRTARLS